MDPVGSETSPITKNEDMAKSERASLEITEPKEVHPVAAVIRYMAARGVRALYQFKRHSPASWGCRLVCGPYIVRSIGRTKKNAKWGASRVMLSLLENNKNFPWLEYAEDLPAPEAEAINRRNVMLVLQTIDRTVRKNQSWWSEECATLFREELEHLLHSQGAKLTETVYPGGSNSSLIIWEIDTIPRILQSAAGFVLSRMRFQLLIDTLSSLMFHVKANEVESPDLTA